MSKATVPEETTLRLPQGEQKEQRGGIEEQRGDNDVPSHILSWKSTFLMSEFRYGSL